MAKKEKSEATEKIVNAEKTKAKKPKSDKPNVLVRAGKVIVRFFKDFRGETKKIVWPDAKTVLKNTGVVLAVVAMFLVFIYLIDLGLSKSIDLLSNVARGDSETTTAVAEQTQPTTAAALDSIIESDTAAPEADTDAAQTEAPADATQADATQAAADTTAAAQ